MVRHYRRLYPALKMLIDRATIDVALDNLPDDELLKLHRTLERGVSCMEMDIPLSDAGLYEDYFDVG